MVDQNIVTRQLAALQEMPLKELQEKFSELFGVTTKSYNVRQLRRRLAFRIQEIYYGGLNQSEKEILLHIGSKDPYGRLEKQNPDKIENVQGTRFQRQWRGRLYETISLGDGTFEYQGRVFSSLSAVANEITGTRWNGRLFFGLIPKRRM